MMLTVMMIMMINHFHLIQLHFCAPQSSSIMSFGFFIGVFKVEMTESFLKELLREAHSKITCLTWGRLRTNDQPTYSHSTE